MEEVKVEDVVVSQGLFDDIIKVVGDSLKPVLKPMVKNIAEKVVFPLMDAVVAKTKNPFDDMAWAALKKSTLEAIDKWNP